MPCRCPVPCAHPRRSLCSAPRTAAACGGVPMGSGGWRPRPTAVGVSPSRGCGRGGPLRAGTFADQHGRDGGDSRFWQNGGRGGMRLRLHVLHHVVHVPHGVADDPRLLLREDGAARRLERELVHLHPRVRVGHARAVRGDRAQLLPAGAVALERLEELLHHGALPRAPGEGLEQRGEDLLEEQRLGHRQACAAPERLLIGRRVVDALLPLQLPLALKLALEPLHKLLVHAELADAVREVRALHSNLQLENQQLLFVLRGGCLHKVLVRRHVRRHDHLLHQVHHTVPRRGVQGSHEIHLRVAKGALGIPQVHRLERGPVTIFGDEGVLALVQELVREPRVLKIVAKRPEVSRKLDYIVLARSLKRTSRKHKQVHQLQGIQYVHGVVVSVARHRAFHEHNELNQLIAIKTQLVTQAP
mmetsp:Transcript_33122/g.78554  ORF Transcript_33122/g.78554 Transcript_33122/m.78554 type:complete len:416 (-) Transcript_33122:662-1909(-)